MFPQFLEVVAIVFNNYTKYDINCGMLFIWLSSVLGLM
jgi:hypothetical protein